MSKPIPDFFLTNRRFLDHKDLVKNRHWQLAWLYIVGRANFETAFVNLTDVFREVSDMFNHRTWRYFMDWCVAEKMLHGLEQVNLGRGKGCVTTAFVTKYAEYQGKEDPKSREKVSPQMSGQLLGHSSPQMSPHLSAEKPMNKGQMQNDVNANVTANVESVSPQMSGQLSVSYKEILKNLKEDKELKEVEVAEYSVTKPPHQKFATATFFETIKSRLRSCWVSLENEVGWGERLSAWQSLSEEAQANAFAKAQKLSSPSYRFATALIDCLDEAASFHKPQTEKGSGAGPGLEPGIEHNPNRLARDNWINEMWDEDYHRAISTGKAHDEAANYADAMRQDRLNSKYEPSPPKTMDEAHQAWMKQPTPGAREVRA